MNQTALASLISQCVLQLLERNLDTRKNATEQKEPQYKPYDNAYFFILFVMLFYSFLALTVFFGYVRSKKAVSKQDPYQEFIEDRNRNKKGTQVQCINSEGHTGVVHQQEGIKGWANEQEGQLLAAF
uniref:Uncharacterized protein n=1 Tax=Junco hyemalis TaxID=40217 RepID=A0A8C5JPF1_JUNHY